jgi:DNA-directed RNA polymerase subunit K
MFTQIQMKKQDFTKYEIARIIGARALQIAMDAPLLLKIPESDLQEMRYDAIKIAEREFEEEILPIAIHRPKPRRGGDKLATVKEDTVTDEELIEKAKEVEKEIAENPEEYSLVESDDDSSDDSDSPKES